MSKRPSLTRSDRKLIRDLLRAHATLHPSLELFRDQLMPALARSDDLMKQIHSMRSRLKDPKRLKDKLERKIIDARVKGKGFAITQDNLARKINDLLGVRILHIQTRQIQAIDEALKKVFVESKFDLLEGPLARTWDDESREFFKGCGIKTRKSPSMYTSVHYVIGSASRTRMTAEIQVRTLSEEVWGEVDHSMNYPHPSKSIPCREQLKVLARVTSSATRLVDSIFSSSQDHAVQGARIASLRKRAVSKSRASGSGRRT